MAEVDEDQWLYGSNPPPPEDVAMDDVSSAAGKQPAGQQRGAEQPTEGGGAGDGDQSADGAGQKDQENELVLEDIDDDSDDDVNVVIGDIKTTPSSYPGFKLSKGGGQFSTPASGDKAKNQGSFGVGEFDGVGTINGVPAHEFNLDSLDDKPWRKPGADITDYFNYGFNEDTWRAYCDRQKRMRQNESGVGIANVPSKPFQHSLGGGGDKYGAKSAGPAQSAVRRHPGTIDVIGATAPSRRFDGADETPVVPSAFSQPPPVLPPAPLPVSYTAPPPGYVYQPPQPYYEPAQYGAPAPWPNPPLTGWGGVPAPVEAPPLLPPPAPLSPVRASEGEPDMDRYTPSILRRSPDPWSPPGSDRDRQDRERDDRKDRDSSSSRHHRRRSSRSRSRERSRRHRSRSRSPSHRHRSSKKSKKKDKNPDSE